ncbi:MAG: alpha/beta fold hydrolase [Actinomycetota bacterium]|nr:alpha/beta fold hydrolase [Actinomycetota bacterium]
MGSPPVLLVHGFASSFERNWREPGWVDLLTESGHQVVGVDLPGHGAGARYADPGAYASLDRAVEEQLPDGPLDGVGFSLGGWVLLRIAARRPGLFERIVTGGVGANVLRSEDPEPLARAVETGVAPEGAPEPAAAFARFGQAPGNDRLALAAVLRATREHLEAAELARIDCPVLVVLGDRDFAGPGEPLVEALPDGRLLRIPGLDHFAAPRDYRFLDAAIGFLDREDRSARPTRRTIAPLGASSRSVER